MVTTAANGTTTVTTPLMTVGTAKAGGTVTLGAGSTFSFGNANGGFTNLTVGNETIGTGTSFTSTFDASAAGAIFKGTLGRC